MNMDLRRSHGVRDRCLRRRARRGRSARLTALAVIALAAFAHRASADVVLAESLASAIESSSSLSAESRRLLARRAFEASIPLPAFDVETSARFGRDLKAVIAARVWPFEGTGRDLSREGVAWLEQGVVIAIERLPALPHPTAPELAEVKAWPEHAARAAAAYTREALAHDSAVVRDRICALVRQALKEREPLFGNAFVPLLLRPCSSDPASATDIHAVVKAALESDAFLVSQREMRRSLASRLSEMEASVIPDFEAHPERQAGLIESLPESSNQRLDEFVEGEAGEQIASILQALRKLSIPCLTPIASKVMPPQWHVDAGQALQEREAEQATALASTPFTRESAGQGAARGSGDAGTGSGAPADGRRLTMDEAIERVLTGSGVVVVHATAIPPTSWSRTLLAPAGN